MGIFDTTKPTETKDFWKPKLKREGEERILFFNCDFYNKLPSIENDPVTMSKALKYLKEESGVTKLVFFQKRDYEYDTNQTFLLLEIAKAIGFIESNKDRLSLFQYGEDPRFRDWYMQKNKILNKLVYFDLVRDPISTYVEIKRLLRDEIIFKDGLNKTNPLLKAEEEFIRILNWLKLLLDKTKLIEGAKKIGISGHKVGDRTIYDSIFTPMIKPDFMSTKLQAAFPKDAELLETYNIDEAEVNIFRIPNSSQYLYHIMPPEFQLTEEEYELLDAAREVMISHTPTKEDFVDPELMREVNFSIGAELLKHLANEMGVKLGSKKLNALGRILLRYSVGFGLIEVLMQDGNIQDVSINSPPGRTPLFIVHSHFQDCVTNIIPTKSEAEAWATKLRLISGRPLDEANPILDTELDLPGARTRVSSLHPPMSHSGLAFSFRRHSDDPWTYAKLMAVKSLNPLAAGLLSFIIDGKRSILIAGTRSSGKTSFLSASLLEILRRYRIITIEDTLEIPTTDMRKLGYNLESIKVSSALSATAEKGVSATDGIRSTLRLGDSALIVGEVRSKECIALYEAMRIGASANVVAGTIHADSPYGVYDRVVNDIGIPKTSFKATDVIVMAAPIISPGGMHAKKRIVSITEVRKFWEGDPVAENGFVDLMKYDPHTDQLEPTQDLLNGDSEVLKAIAATRPRFAGNWDALWSDILLRAKIKETQLKYGVMPEFGADFARLHFPLLEAPVVVRVNDMYHTLVDQISTEEKHLTHEQLTKKIYNAWERWFKNFLKIKEYERISPTY